MGAEGLAHIDDDDVDANVGTDTDADADTDANAAADDDLPGAKVGNEGLNDITMVGITMIENGADIQTGPSSSMRRCFDASTGDGSTGRRVDRSTHRRAKTSARQCAITLTRRRAKTSTSQQAKTPSRRCVDSLPR